MKQESLGPVGESLKAEYLSLRSSLDEFASEMGRQLDKLLDHQKVSLGVPIQNRVKTWESIQAKLERKPRDIESIKELSDLIGLRIILLFRRDVYSVSSILEANYHVLERENVADRLEVSQFGYSSIHFILEFPPKWLAVPTLAHLGGLKAEIQVRTLAQHIWAAASHTLQYKQESDVPSHIRRTIHRVSALLETVDLELERVLGEREAYLVKPQAHPIEEGLNVDSLARILKENLPEENMDEVEPYAELLQDLAQFEVVDQAKLVEIITKHKAAILAEDAESVEAIRNDQHLQELLIEDRERLGRGVFFTHVGLTRGAMSYEFGERWQAYWRERPGRNKG